jgi:signal transduction histidine kinase
MILMPRLVVRTRTLSGGSIFANPFAIVWNWVYLLAFIGGLFMPTVGKAQKFRHEIDSLRAIWYSPPGAIQDSVRLRAGLNLTSRYSDVFYDSIRLISQEMDAYGIRSGNRLWRAQANCRMGKYYYNKDQLTEARAAYQRALSFLDDEQDPIAVTSHLGLGRLYAQIRKTDSCFYHLNYAKNLAIRYRFQDELGHVYSSLGFYSYTLGNKYIDALDYFTEAIKIKEPKYQVKDLINMSTVFSILGLYTEASDCLKKSLEIAESEHSPADRISIYSAMIKLRPTLREIDQILQKGNALADQYKLTKPQFWMYLSAIAAYTDSLQFEQAAHCIQAAQKGLSSPDVQLYLAVLQAQLYQGQGYYKQSLGICLKTQPMLEQSQTQDQLLILYGIMSRNYEALGQPDKALLYERKRETLEQALNNRQLVNEALSTYVKKITENEKKALQSAKENAEQLTVKTKANSRLVYGLLSLLSLFLAVTGAIYYRSFQQKTKAAATLEAANLQLKQEQIRLQQSNQKLRRFSGIVSHDILSNLDLMLSTGHVMVGSKPKPEPLLQYYEMSQHTSSQLKTYCIGLLEEARQAVSPGGHTPNPILQSVYHRYEPALQAKKFRVDLDPLPASTLPPVVMEQLFQNLISNALRHAGSVQSPWLHIGADTDAQGRAYWVVEDNGPGIPASQMDAIFQGKTTNHKDNSQKIGLSLLKQTLQEYDADIRAEQRPGGGARFVVTFGDVA